MTHGNAQFKGKKTALVLSGGVVKAASWHVGVALALEELGFELVNNQTALNKEMQIGTYVGSSAGSLINILFASGFKPIDVIQAQMKNTHPVLPAITYKDMLSLQKPRKRPVQSKIYDPLEGLPGFIKPLLSPFFKLDGLFTTHGLYHYLKKNVLLSNRYSEYKADVFTVATQLDNSRKCIFSKFNYPNPSHDNTAQYYTNIPVAESVAASMSVPPFYSPYPIANPHTGHIDYYIDGEIRETLSTHVAIDNGCDLVISSWTHTPYHYHDEIGSLVNYGIPAICVQAIYLLIQKKIVESRARRANAKDIIDSVYEYMKENKFSRVHTSTILNIIESKLYFKKNVTLIDIYPKHNKYNVFFQSSFSLNPNKTSELMKLGYRRTIEVFKNQEWQSS